MFLHGLDSRLEWSVIIPLHRSRPGLERCLKSVAAQWNQDMEILLVDHRHNAAALGFCLPPEVGLLYVDDTGSMAGDWNRAIAQAKGRRIHLMHDDDYLLPRFYDSLDHVPAPFTVTGYRNEDQTGKVTFEHKACTQPVWPAIAINNQHQPSAVVIERAVYEQFGGYLTNPELRHCPDWELYARVLSRGVKFGEVKEILCVHTEGGESCESAAPVHEILRSYSCLFDHLAKEGVQLDALGAGVQGLLSVATRHALKEAADEMPHQSLWNLAVDLERQRRRYAV